MTSSDSQGPLKKISEEPSAMPYQHATRSDWLACEKCGQVQHSVPLHSDEYLACTRCDHPLHFGRPAWLEISAALTLTSIILFIISNSFVFLGLEVGTFHHEANLLGGVWVLVAFDHWLLAGLVFLTIFLFPLCELLALSYLVLPCYLGYRLPYQHTVLRWLTKAAPWSMLEIFLLGVLVTSVKLGDMATIVLGTSIVAFFILVAVLAATYWYVDKRALWSWLQPNNCFTGKDNDLLYDCGVCHALVGESLITRSPSTASVSGLDHNEYGTCPRCRNVLHTRKPESLQRTLALTIAAALLYIPANVFPIMSMTTLFEERYDTIFSGVVALIGHGLWGVAAIVFVASLVVPMAKLVILAYLVWTVHSRKRTGMVRRQWLFTATEWIGRWSMVDVFVVTLLAGLVQFGYLGAIAPGPALLPFAAVVVLTMLAAHAFDPRLIWDAAARPENHFAFEHKHHAS